MTRPTDHADWEVFREAYLRLQKASLEALETHQKYVGQRGASVTAKSFLKRSKRLARVAAELLDLSIAGGG